MHLSRLCAAWISLAIVSGSTAAALAQSSGSVQWVTFQDCPVLLEHRYVVPSKEAGAIESVAVEQNAAVTKGQLLLSLEKDEAEMDLETAKDNEASARHLAADDSDLQLAQLFYKQSKMELESNSEIAGSISATELRRQELEVARAGREITKAQLALERFAMQSKVAAKIVRAKGIKLANRDVHAPSSGIVTELLVRPGEWVDAGKPVMVIADYRQLQVNCLIPFRKADFKKLVGLEVRVESNQRDASDMPITLRGQISSFDHKLNANGEVLVHCRIENKQVQGEWLLMPGMEVRLEVAVPEAPANEKPPLISQRPA